MAEEFDARGEALVRTPQRDRRARGRWAHHLRMCRAERAERADGWRRDAEAARALDAMDVVVAIDCPILPVPEPGPGAPCEDCRYVAKRCRC